VAAKWQQKNAAFGRKMLLKQTSGCDLSFAAWPSWCFSSASDAKVPQAHRFGSTWYWRKWHPYKVGHGRVTYSMTV